MFSIADTILRRVNQPTAEEMIAAEISSRIESYQALSKKVSYLEKKLEKETQKNDVLEQRLNNFILEEQVRTITALLARNIGFF